MLRPFFRESFRFQKSSVQLSVCMMNFHHVGGDVLVLRMSLVLEDDEEVVGEVHTMVGELPLCFVDLYLKSCHHLLPALSTLRASFYDQARMNLSSYPGPITLKGVQEEISFPVFFNTFRGFTVIY